MNPAVVPAMSQVVKTASGASINMGTWVLVVLAVIGLVGAGIKQWGSWQRNAIDERSGLRKEFIEEMKELRDEVRALRTENSQLRQEIRELHGVIDGIRRGQLQGSLSAQAVVAGALPHSPELQRALDAVDRITREEAV